MVDIDATDRTFLRVDEVMTILGVSRRTVYYWVQQGRIPHVHIGRTLRFPIHDLRRLIVRLDLVQPDANDASST